MQITKEFYPDRGEFGEHGYSLLFDNGESVKGLPIDELRQLLSCVKIEFKSDSNTESGSGCNGHCSCSSHRGNGGQLDLGLKLLEKQAYRYSPEEREWFGIALQYLSGAMSYGTNKRGVERSEASFFDIPESEDDGLLFTRAEYHRTKGFHHAISAFGVDNDVVSLLHIDFVIIRMLLASAVYRKHEAKTNGVFDQLDGRPFI
jgi:hypothetical protein